MELAPVVTVRPTLQAAIEAAFQEEPTGQGADCYAALRAVREARIEFGALQRLSEWILRPDDIMGNLIQPHAFFSARPDPADLLARDIDRVAGRALLEEQMQAPVSELRSGP